MPVGLFNPKDNTNATSTRPAHASMAAAVRRWFTDAGAGTRIHAQDLNAVIAQFRGAMDAFGITDEEGDDTALTQLLASVFTPKFNFIRNPSFELWQAGTSFNTGYMADMWKCRGDLLHAFTFSRQPGFSGSRYCMRMQRAPGSTNQAQGIFHTVFPTLAVLALAGKRVTISLDVRVGANFSANGFITRIYTSTGIEEVSTNGTFPTASVQAHASGSGVLTPGNTYRLKWVTAALPTNASEMSWRAEYTPLTATPAEANDYLEFTNIKIEAGTIATDFVPEPLSQTLEQARRFYQKSFNEAITPAQNIGAGTGEFRFPALAAGAVTQRFGTIQLIPMRSAPAITLFNPAAANAQVRDITAAADCSAAAVANISEKGFTLSCTGNAGTAVGNHLGVHWVADARIF